MGLLDTPLPGGSSQRQDFKMLKISGQWSALDPPLCRPSPTPLKKKKGNTNGGSSCSRPISCSHTLTSLRSQLRILHRLLEFSVQLCSPWHPSGPSHSSPFTWEAYTAGQCLDHSEGAAWAPQLRTGASSVSFCFLFSSCPGSQAPSTRLPWEEPMGTSA